MILLLTGPEKTGKTTLAQAVVKESKKLGVHGVYAALRRPPELDWRVYLDLVKMGCRTDVLVVLDRAWPDEAVYNGLLGRRVTVPEFWAEWCLGDLMRTVGIGVVMAPKKRLAPVEKDDHPVRWEDESKAFVTYGRRWEYDVADPLEEGDLIDLMITSVDEVRREMTDYPDLVPPYYAGPRFVTRLIVGEARNESSRDPLAWGPMTTRTFIDVARIEQTLGYRLGRTNAADLDRPGLQDLVKQATNVICLGREAERRVLHLRGKVGVTTLPHPAAVNRWGRYSEERALYSGQLQDAFKL